MSEALAAKAFNQDQPRDDAGRWTDGAGAFNGKIENDVTDAYSGQVNGTFRATGPGGEAFGHLDWQEYGDTVTIAMVQVEDAARRKGVGTALVDKLRAEFPDKWVVWGAMTADGAALREAYDKKRGTVGGGNVVVDERGALRVPAGALIHGTNAEAADAIEKGGLQPRVGDFVRSAYPELADTLNPVVFLDDPTAKQSGARSAMTEAVARASGKSFDKVTRADVAKHGALVVVRPSGRLYRYSGDDDRIIEEGTGRDVTGLIDKPPAAEDGDIFTEDFQEPGAVVRGEAVARWWDAHERARKAAPIEGNLCRGDDGKFEACGIAWQDRGDGRFRVVVDGKKSTVVVHDTTSSGRGYYDTMDPAFRRGDWRGGYIGQTRADVEAAIRSGALRVWTMRKGEQIAGDLCRGDDGKFEACGSGAAVAPAHRTMPDHLGRMRGRLPDGTEFAGTNTEAAGIAGYDNAFGAAARVDSLTGEAVGVHVTDQPERAETALREGKDLADTRDEGKYGDIGPGLYMSAAPQLWMGRSTDKWSFAENLTAAERGKIADKLKAEIGRQRQDRYITQSEWEAGLRDIRNWRQRPAMTPVFLADQPYNLPWWKGEFLKPLGIAPAKEPSEVEMRVKGNFVDAETLPKLQSFDPETIESLRDGGWDGAYHKGGFAGYPQLVVWNKHAVSSFGNWSRTKKAARLRRGKRTLRLPWRMEKARKDREAPIERALAHAVEERLKEQQARIVDALRRALARARKSEAAAKYDPSQPRDASGQWTGVGTLPPPESDDFDPGQEALWRKAIAAGRKEVVEGEEDAAAVHAKAAVDLGYEYAKSVQGYTQHGYTYINRMLRNGAPDPARRAEDVERDRAAADRISAVIAAAPPLAEARKVYRGVAVGADKEEAFVAGLREHVGGTVRLPGFQSSSFSSKVAEHFGGVVMRISTSRGFAAQALSSAPSEHEFILGHNWGYRVDAVTKAPRGGLFRAGSGPRWYVDMTVVDTTPGSERKAAGALARARAKFAQPADSFVFEPLAKADGDCGAGEPGRPGFQPGNTCGRRGVSTATPDEVLARAASDPDVAKARERNAHEMTTAEKYQHPDGAYTAERQALHERIVDNMLNPRAAAPEGERPRMVMLLGLPASGKTQVLRGGIQGDFTTIDADSIKAKFPEYDGANASVVHKESGHVAETMLLPRAVEARHNILLDWTGKNSEKTLHFVRKMVDAGYEVEVHHVTIPPAEAASRALGRFKTDGRFVDPSYIITEVGTRPDKTYDVLKNSGLLKRWRSFDNDVPKGSPPRLVEDSARN